MHRKNSQDETEATSIIGSLRCLAPSRSLSVSEAHRVAELQATQLLLSAGVRGAPIPSEVVTCQRRVLVDYDFDMPDSASGACHWDESLKRWIITINGHHPATRQRFTLLHEYKHILDHDRPRLLSSDGKRAGHPVAEVVADYFAACALMPRTLILRAWNANHQSPGDLARRFDVSERAMEIRLAHLRLLLEPRDRKEAA